MGEISWNAGTWTHPPASVEERAGELFVTAVEGSDAWRHTSYGFIHESEHGLLAPFPKDCAMEVEFTAKFSAQFDQAGIFIRISDEHWIKAGVEFADGRPQLGAVVTNVHSDWSLAPVPGWIDRRIMVRVSRVDDAVTVRAAPAGEPLQLVRVVPLSPYAVSLAGPMVCAPSRSGLTVPFHAWRLREPDVALH